MILVNTSLAWRRAIARGLAQKVAQLGLGLGLGATLLTLVAPPAQAAGEGNSAAATAVNGNVAAPAVNNSSLDALLLYQLLVGEIQLRNGQPAMAYEIVLDAARRSKDPLLFRRAVDVALGARAGDQALAATRAWRSALPGSVEAISLQLQILSALNRPAEAAEPLRSLLARTPEAERGSLIASLPRFFERAADPKAVAAMLEQALQPHLGAGPTRTAARTTLGRALLRAGNPQRALALAAQAHAEDRTAAGPVLLALELMPREPAAEATVVSYLRGPAAEPALRLAYVRVLTQAQRLDDAVAQLRGLTAQQPALAPPWLTLGALLIELKQARPAEEALLKFVALTEKAAGSGNPGGAPTPPPPPTPAPTPTPAAPPSDDDDEDDEAPRPQPGQESSLAQAWLMLAQAAELRQDDAAAEGYLSRVDSPRRVVEVQSRRAAILARRGQIEPARELIRRLPERSEADARAKLGAEAQLMRGIKRWQDAHDLFEQAAKRWPDDVDLLYEQAMMAEKLDRLEPMERLLRRAIELKPDHQHAYNALGYSLADRGVRLPEARELIRKALELAPGDPFITDSLGWVEFRLGRHAEALALLKRAYAVRPDTEIAAHLGEVLWVSGQREEARRVWREARRKDEANDVLIETLARIKPDL